jgi:hypothetical protein
MHAVATTMTIDREIRFVIKRLRSPLLYTSSPHRLFGVLRRSIKDDVTHLREIGGCSPDIELLSIFEMNLYSRLGTR